MFSDAISSISWRCRPSSPLIAAAISGSASESVALKNESGAEAVFALEDGAVIGQISPPPQAFGAGCGRSSVAVKRALAEYHIARHGPSHCGTSLIFMQDMVGKTGIASRRNSPDPLRPNRGTRASRRGTNLKPRVPRLDRIVAAVKLAQIGQPAHREAMGILLAGRKQRGDIYGHLRARF